MQRSGDPANWLTAAPFAHRGLHDATHPENSLAAFKAAQAAGFGIELDVRLTRDRVPVVFHDARLRRMTGQRGAIASSALNDLRGLRLHNSDAQIPTLEEVLHLLGGQVATLIELKPDAGSRGYLESAVAGLVDRQSRTAVISIDMDTVQRVRSDHPEIVCGWVVERNAADDRGSFAAIDAMGLDFLAFDRRALPHPFAAQARAAGLSVLSWTIRSAQMAERLQDHVDNIIFERYLPARERNSN